MQVPIEPCETRPPVHAQAATPIRDSRPPQNDSSQTNHRQTECANAVDGTARPPKQEVLVEVHKPFNHAKAGRLGIARTLKRVAINDGAARNAHYEYIET